MSKQSSANSGSVTPKPSSHRPGGGKTKETQEEGNAQGSGSNESGPQASDATPAEGEAKGPKKDAPKLWADPLNPDLPPNWRFLLERGYIRSINFEFTSFGKSVIVDVPSTDPSGNLVLLRKSGRDAQNYFKDAGVLDKFGRVPKNLLKNPLAGATPQGVTPALGPKAKEVAPKRSLIESDFEGGLPHLQKRASEVGRALTHTTFRGRILCLFVPDLKQVQTIEQWWRDAPPANRTRVLMDGKRFDALCGREDLLGKCSEMMKNVSCPFRGALSPKESSSSGTGEQGSASAEGSNDPSA